MLFAIQCHYIQQRANADHVLAFNANTFSQSGFYKKFLKMIQTEKLIILIGMLYAHFTSFKMFLPSVLVIYLFRYARQILSRFTPGILHGPHYSRLFPPSDSRFRARKFCSISIRNIDGELSPAALVLTNFCQIIQGHT